MFLSDSCVSDICNIWKELAIVFVEYVSHLPPLIMDSIPHSAVPLFSLFFLKTFYIIISYKEIYASPDNKTISAIKA